MSIGCLTAHDISRFLKASFRGEAQYASATTAAEQHRQELENLKSQSSVEVGGSLMKYHEIDVHPLRNRKVCSIAFGSFWFRLLSGTATERQSRWNPGEFWGFLALSLFWNWLPAFQLVTVVIAATFDLSGLNVLPVDRHRVLPQMRQQNSNSKKSTPWKQKQQRQVVTCCPWGRFGIWSKMKYCFWNLPGDRFDFYGLWVTSQSPPIS